MATDLRLVSHEGTFVDAALEYGDGKVFPLAEYATDLHIHVGLDDANTVTMTLDLVALDVPVEHLRFTPEQLKILKRIVDEALAKGIISHGTDGT